jgi:acetyl esterase/lipase
MGVIMTDHTGFAASPIPARPSPESVRLLRRMSGSRAMQERIRPGGPSLRLYRLLIAAIALSARPPAGGTATSVRYTDGVRGRLVTPRDADPANGILMWVHGGGFVSGLPRLEQQIAAAYGETARIPTFLPRYRLAPEHPFPAAADDLLAAYRNLLGQGFPADRIRVAGMSAGGGLVTGLLGDIDRAGLPMPAAMLLVSPVLQLSAESIRRRDAEQPDPCTSPGFIERTNKAYAGDTPLTDPRLNYLDADMRTWPPTLIQLGEPECLVPEAEQLGAALRAAGVRCEVQVWPGQVHGFPGMGARRVPEAKAAVEYGQRFLAVLFADADW